MRYVSIFSGIEAASVAWRELGWEPVAFSEIEPFPCAVLAQRFPDVPNLGDITKVDWSTYAGAVDLVCGGSPCQSFSIAGKRDGLSGASGLMWEYVRAVREIRPRWLVWENVPGALSSGKGEDFRCLLRSLDDLGYGLAWRVLDAQFFGVPQRRRRLFLVGCLGDAGRAAEVLFEPESLRWDNPSSREKRKELAGASGAGAGGDCRSPIAFTDSEDGCLTPWDVQSRRIFDNSSAWPALYAGDGGGHGYALQSYALRMRAGKPGGGKGPLVQTDVSGTLATGNDQTIFQPICMGYGNANTPIDRDLRGCLKVGGEPPMVVYPDDQTPMVLYEGLLWTVRRLMPVECERLQGFPSVVELEFDDMTRDEIIACALASKDIEADADSGKVYTHRGPGGMRLDEPREIGNTIVNGYKVANLTANGQKKQVRINRVIYIAAYGAIPYGYVIDHINNDKSDNRISNLQAITPEDNSTKAKLDGCYLCGNDNPRSKIDVELKPVIFNEYMDGNATYRELAQKYGISKSRVHQIVHEYDWTKIPWRGKPAEECPDGPRYKAIGNSMAVPVMRWICESIAHVIERDEREDER